MKKAKTFIAILLASLMLCGCAAPAQLASAGSSALESAKESVASFSSWVEKKTDKLESFLHGKGNESTHIFNTVQDFFEDRLEDLNDALSGTSGDHESNELSREELQAIRDESVVHFSEMVYERPDIDKFESDVNVLKDALKAGTMSLEEIESLIDDVYDDFYSFRTMNNLSNVRSCLNMLDEYYSTEYNWCSEQGAVVEDLMDSMYYACGGSDYARDLERDYFWEGFAEEYADEQPHRAHQSGRQENRTDIHMRTSLKSGRKSRRRQSPSGPRSAARWGSPERPSERRCTGSFPGCRPSARWRR